MKKIFHKEIPFAIAILIALSLSFIPATFGLMIVFEPVHKAQALIGSNIGLQVLSPPLSCVQDELSPTCTASCSICGDLAGLCVGAFEVKAQFLSGLNLLHHSTALCLRNTFIQQGSFRTGARCKGKIIYSGLHTLYNFGCS